MQRSFVVSVGLLILFGACSAKTVPGALSAFDEAASFAVLGDFGDGSSSEYEVAAALRNSIAGRPIDALITTGDNFYSDELDVIWSHPYGWIEDYEIPVIAAWGNHDVESSTRQELVQNALKPPGRWFSGPLGTGRLIILDSTRITDPNQAEWLQNELAEAGDPVVVVFHHPALSCGFHGSTKSVQDTWMPLFEQYGVDLVLNGHDHDYERFEYEDTTYVVTGGGGRSLRPLEPCSTDTPEPVVANDTDHHFVRLDITDGRIEGVVLTTAGTIIDEFEIEA